MTVSGTTHLTGALQLAKVANTDVLYMASNGDVTGSANFTYDGSLLKLNSNLNVTGSATIKIAQAGI